jgi:colicin import membrane protein
VKYLETKHERNSARITALIALIVLLLLFVVGPQYLDPPEEYGIAVNFGTTDFGSGNKPLSQPRKAVEEEVVEEQVVEEIQPEEKKVTPTEAVTKAEEVMTQENAEAMAIKKRKEAEEKAKADAEEKVKAEAERVETEKREAEEKKRREEEEKKKKLDNLIGGVKNADGNTDVGEGPDNQGGNKGQLDGNPYAPYNGMLGDGEGGAGYGLNGRGIPSFRMQEGCENEYGLIIVEIVVDRKGQVIKATPGVRGSNNVTSCLKEVAKKIAMSYKWRADSKAPLRQYGKVRVNFSPSN